MMASSIICLLEFWLKNTYFLFQGRYYEKVEGAVIKNLNTAPHPPSLWRRFVDDTFVVIQSAHKNSFIEHINSIDQSIQFTVEDPRIDESMPFGHSGYTATRFKSQQRPIHTDLYLQWDSHLTIAAKYSVVKTLHHRARVVCSSPQLQNEEEHLQKVLKENKYPDWAVTG